MIFGLFLVLSCVRGDDIGRFLLSCGNPEAHYIGGMAWHSMVWHGMVWKRRSGLGSIRWLVGTGFAPLVGWNRRCIARETYIEGGVFGGVLVGWLGWFRWHPLGVTFSTGTGSGRIYPRQ